MSEEIWKSLYIDDEKTNYKVSTKGNVEGSRGIMKHRVHNSGYHEIILRIKKKPIHYLIHRLVCKVYLENNNNLEQVNHKDSNKGNNNVENLEWMSASENVIHSQKNIPHYTRAILKLDLDENIIEKYNSIKEATGGEIRKKSGIIKCATGKQHTAYGYKWKYDTDNKTSINIDDWKDIEEFPRYKISETGELYSKHTKRILIPTLYDNYYRLRLAKNGKYLSKAIHRLVAQTYIENIDNKPIVNHKDGNTMNNNVDNLEWCTHSENVLHAYNTGLNPRRKNKK
jgi:hypothetical protein